MPTYDAILPAGGKIDAEFAKVVGTEYKALILIDGKTVLGRTIEALQTTGIIRNTIVIGPDEVLLSDDGQKATYKLPPGETGPDNIFRGLEQLLKEPEPPEKVLIVTTDLPFLSPAAILDFVNRCPNDRDICVPLIRERDFMERYPGIGATFVKLKDDAWTTGNVFMMDVKALQKAKPHIERVFENRKSKAGMARLLGPVFLLKYLTKRLTLVDIEAKILTMLGCSGAAITKSDPALHFDIDFLDDYEYAVKHVKEK
jgi:CTP:molybdopterin cytidylyltransferase MocA